MDVFVASTSVLCVAKGVNPEALWQSNVVGALYAVVSGTLPLTTALAATLREACNLCDSRNHPSTALLFTNGVLNNSERAAVQSVSNEFRGRLICFGIGSYSEWIQRFVASNDVVSRSSQVAGYSCST